MSKDRFGAPVIEVEEQRTPVVLLIHRLQGPKIQRAVPEESIAPLYICINSTHITRPYTHPGATKYQLAQEIEPADLENPGP